MTDALFAFPELRCFSSGFLREFNRGYAEKQLISRFVTRNVIPETASLVIDMGTTPTVFARVLAEERQSGVQIATHSASVAMQFSSAPGLRVIGYPGTFQPREAGFVPDSRPHHRPHKLNPFAGLDFLAVVTAEAYSGAGGASTADRGIRSLVRLYIRRASAVVMLIDHEKFLRNDRLTITRCGIGDDRWLAEEKPFKLITESEPGKEPDEMKRLMDHPKVKVTQGENEFSNVKMIESILYSGR